MNVENKASRPSSGTTSTSEPMSEPEITESVYLSQQAEAAKAAMAKAASEMKASLQKGVSPASWTRAHPWIGVGAGAAAGLIAGLMLVPSREEQALRRLRRIEEALSPERTAHKENGKSDGNTKEHKGWIGMILKELLGMAGPVVAAILKAQNPAEAANEPQPGDDPTASNPVA